MYEMVYQRRLPQNGLVAKIEYDPAEAMPWRCGYAGSGHYFQTGEEAVEYARSRRFCTARQELLALAAVYKKTGRW